MSGDAGYAPKPGSIADRAIARLALHGPAAEVPTSVLAEEIGVSGEETATCLQPALDAGLLFARKKGGHSRSPLFWSLVDHTAKKNGTTGEAFSPADGKPNGGAASSPAAKAGSQTPQKGPNRDASTGQSHGAEGSASPNGRGNNVAPARGAGPAFLPDSVPGTRAPLTGRTATASMTGEVAIALRQEVLWMNQACQLAHEHMHGGLFGTANV